jgi:fructose-bisphosphate aldolase class I
MVDDPGSQPRRRSTSYDEAMSEMYDQMRDGQGFIAALDQSGGSTPKALLQYGIDESSYADEVEMFDRIHEMRSRIVTSPSFDGERVLGAILFENTMDRDIEGRGSARYLWDVKRVVPFLKVDQGLADEVDGAQTMKPIPGLDDLCRRAVDKGVFGTKMRSVVKQAVPEGIETVVAQQFEVGLQIIGHGLMPIIEPEVDIHCPDKAGAEALLMATILRHLEQLPADVQVMLKLTIPSVDDFYLPLVGHDRVLRVVALSGGYSRDRSNELLARNHGVIASFSRALTEGLTAQMSDAEFDAVLDATIGSIYAASIT